MNLQENIHRIKEMMGLIDEDKESGEKWVKCRNCKKKFTQTIHKGKKSLAICPHCGTHNDSLKESIVPISIRRRVDTETLRKYITLGEINYPTLCDDFDDEYEYSDHVIDYALDEFLSEHKIDIEDEDYYSDVMDYFRNLCRELFGEHLYEVYKTTCSEYNLTEEIVKEEDDNTISSDTIIDFERILNKKMPKKFPWWKEIDIQSIGFQPTIFSGMGGIGQTILYGDLFVDEDWARKKWKDLHSSSTVNFPDTNNLEFNDLLGYDEWMELKQYVGKLYNSLTGRNSERISFNRLNIYFDVPQLPKMEQNESELTERCWKGYTQKGMKTMFGKRYPNCVKKKK